MFKKVLITSTISLLAACGNNDNDSESQQSLTDLGQRQTSEAFSLRVLHMNDHHSHLESDTFDLDVSELALDTRDSNGDPLTEFKSSSAAFRC